MSQTETGDAEYRCTTCGEVLDIITLLSHDCDPMLSASELTRGERNTLMYIESCMVDEKGQLDPDKMNFDDFQNLKLFRAAGLVEVAEHEGERQHSRHGAPLAHKHRVDKFSDAAWDLARDCRQMRATDWIEYDIELGDVGAGE